MTTAHHDHDGGTAVPLSEDEQRILHEIEQQFYETDPDLAHAVGSTSLYRHAFRRIKYATLTFILGIGLLVYALVSLGYIAAFGGFLVADLERGAGVVLAHAAGGIVGGGDGVREVGIAVHLDAVGHAVGELGGRLRPRQRDTDEPDRLDALLPRQAHTVVGGHGPP